MLILIVALFAACWFPIHLMNLLIYFVPAIYQFDTKFGYTLFIAFYLGSHFLSMAHGLVNPLIYLNSGLKFRVSLCIISVGFTKFSLPLTIKCHSSTWAI